MRWCCDSSLCSYFIREDAIKCAKWNFMHSHVCKRAYNVPRHFIEKVISQKLNADFMFAFLDNFEIKNFSYCVFIMESFSLIAKGFEIMLSYKKRGAAS